MQKYKCLDCGFEFVRGQRCPTQDHKQVNFIELNDLELPKETKQKSNKLLGIISKIYNTLRNK